MQDHVVVIRVALGVHLEAVDQHLSCELTFACSSLFWSFLSSIFGRFDIQDFSWHQIIQISSSRADGWSWIFETFNCSLSSLALRLSLLKTQLRLPIHSLLLLSLFLLYYLRFISPTVLSFDLLLMRRSWYPSQALGRCRWINIIFQIPHRISILWATHRCIFAIHWFCSYLGLDSIRSLFVLLLFA